MTHTERCQVYVFNVTNPEAWLEGEGRVRLEVQEVGPLVYRETWWRTNVEVHQDGRVSYDLVKRFLPCPALSRVREDTLVTLPNIPYWAGAARMDGQVGTGSKEHGTWNMEHGTWNMDKV